MHVGLSNFFDAVLDFNYWLYYNHHWLAIHGLFCFAGGSGNSNTRRPLQSGAGPPDGEDFVSRYDRMIGADNNFSVFSSNLPGKK